MESATSYPQTLLDNLHSKWMLTDIKGKLIQTTCSLLDDQVYTKKDAADILLEVIALIEQEEERLRMDLLQIGQQEVM